MNIALVQQVVGFGGIEQHVLTLAGALRKLGHEAHIIGLVDIDGFDTLRKWADPRKQIPVHWPGGWPPTPGAPPGPLPVHELLAEIDPDVINVQLPVHLATVVPAGKPIVGTVHGIASMQGRLPPLKALVCMDGRMLEHVKSHSQLVGNLPAPRIEYGVNLKRFTFKDNAAEREGTAYFGRIAGRNTRALGTLRGAGSSLHIYGDEPGISALRAQCKAYPNVECFGPTKPEKVLHKYRVVVANGVAAIEAMACGALLFGPSLGPHNMGGYQRVMYSPERFYPDEKVGEWPIMQDAQALQGAKVATARARFCREWVEAHHDAAKMAEAFVGVYERAMGG